MFFILFSFEEQLGFENKNHIWLVFMNIKISEEIRND